MLFLSRSHSSRMISFYDYSFMMNGFTFASETMTSVIDSSDIAAAAATAIRFSR